ncbi:MAG: hypothetical protein FD138_4675 [Planctomycetota bacterium]|nr:MAG: hypothetical protein FD138_4675 [Planctomycetota bacterium]
MFLCDDVRGSELIGESGRHFGQSLRFQLRFQFRSPAAQPFGWDTRTEFGLRRDVDPEPLSERLVNADAVRLADVRAMRVGRRRAGDGSLAMRERQRRRLLIEAEDRLQPLPDRIAVLVPVEFVSVDQFARCDAADDHPRQEAPLRSIGGRVAQVAS